MKRKRDTKGIGLGAFETGRATPGSGEVVEAPKLLRGSLTTNQRRAWEAAMHSYLKGSTWGQFIGSDFETRITSDFTEAVTHLHMAPDRKTLVLLVETELARHKDFKKIDVDKVRVTGGFPRGANIREIINATEDQQEYYTGARLLAEMSRRKYPPEWMESGKNYIIPGIVVCKPGGQMFIPEMLRISGELRIVFVNTQSVQNQFKEDETQVVLYP